MSVARGASVLSRSALSRLLVPAAGVVCAVGLVAGCTSSAEPSPLPEPTITASPSPSASASASATPPTLPAEAEGTSPRAAKAFARFYVESVNFAMTTGDTAQMEKLATKNCETCATLTKRIRGVYVQGGRFEGGTWRIRAANYTPLQGDNALVLMSMDIDAQAVVERDGASPSRTPSSRGSLELHLAADADGWTVEQLDAR